LHGLGIFGSALSIDEADAWIYATALVDGILVVGPTSFRAEDSS